MTATDVRPPATFHRPGAVIFASEGVRAAGEMTCFGASLPYLRRLPKGDGRPVLVIPGFTASDRSTAPMRSLLAHLGYDAYGWEQGQNLGPTPHIVDGLLERFDAIRGATGQTLTLIGWSLGGLYSRALVAREPESVRHVITMGSPFRLSKTEETNAGRLFDLLTPLHRHERARGVTFRREPYNGAPVVPSTAIFTKADGVVPWKSCVDEQGSQSENIEVNGSHCGLGVNPAVMRVLSDRLQLPEGKWKPFQPDVLARSLFHATPYKD